MEKYLTQRCPGWLELGGKYCRKYYHLHKLMSTQTVFT